MSVHTVYRSVIDWATRVVTRPRHELTRWQLAARFAYDLCRFGGRQLRQDRAPQMAAALAFHTLFGLLPVLVVGAVVARSVLGPTEFLSQAHTVLDAFRLYDIEITTAATLGGVAETTAVSLGDWLYNLFDQAMGLNLAALGGIGLLVLLYTAISLIVTIENAFNTIYRAPEGRSWLRRIPLYWFLLTISPIAMAVTIYIDRQFDSVIGGVALWHWLLVVIKVVWGFSMAWLVMFCVYSFVPNTAVKYRATVIGAFVATILVEAGRHGLGAYFENAVSFSKIYGSLGLIPLFMMWVYLMWLAVLFGLEVASILQNLRGRRLEELEKRARRSTLVDPASVVTVMKCIAARFVDGLSVTPNTIAGEARLTESNVTDILTPLEKAQFVYRLARPQGEYTLARPPQQIGADLLLQIGFQLVDQGSPPESDSLIDRLRKAQLRIASETTLAALATAGGPSNG